MRKAQTILEYLIIMTFIVIAIIFAATDVLMPSVARVYRACLSGMREEAAQKRNINHKSGEYR